MTSWLKSQAFFGIMNAGLTFLLPVPKSSGPMASIAPESHPLVKHGIQPAFHAVGSAALLGLILTSATSGLRAQPVGQSGQQPLPPFVGVTSDGRVQPGLFPLRQTGISAAPMVSAARSFLDSLTPDQRQKLQAPLTSETWRRWTNVSAADRSGLSYGAMTHEQQHLADAFLHSFLSAEGFRQAKAIMLINGYLAEVTGNHQRYGVDQFWLMVYGIPSLKQPWGWRLEGHHLVINVAVVGDQVVMTPTFMGAEPTIIPDGPHKGLAVMQTEESRARRFMASLRPDQKQKAVLKLKKDGVNILAEAYKDNLIVPYAGLRASELDLEQQSLLLQVIAAYADQFRPGQARIRMAEVKAHLNNTWFAWIGGLQPQDPMYYRIQSPVVLIEFDQQRALSLPGDPNIPLRTHVHSIVRTPNGNDYGRDLLREHIDRDHSALSPAVSSQNKNPSP